LLSWNNIPVIKTHIHFQKDLVIQLVWLMMVQFLVFIFVLVAKCRNITQNGRGSGKTSGAFSIKELLIGKTAFNNYAIVFIFYEGEVIVMLYKLREHKGSYSSVLQFLSLCY